MTDINGVDVVEGDKLEILGRTYVIDLDHSLAGDFVVWSDEGSFLRIYATPNFEMTGVPVQIDYESYNITADCYEGEIRSYEHYKQIVKEISERLLAKLPECDCATNKDAQKCDPIEMKGWGVYLCGYCTGVLGTGKIGKIIGGIEVVEGDKLEILGRTYVLHIEEELSGEHPVWIDENSVMRIWATPNYEIEGVIIQLDYDVYNITNDCYKGEIKSYDHYKQIVKDLAEKILTTLPECKCVDHIEKIVPIRIIGWNMYQCRQCGGIIKENQNMLKKDDVVEELSKMMDGYFEEKAGELKLKSGDISPEQSFRIDEAVEKLADVVIQWAEQNQELKEDSYYGKKQIKDNRPRISLAGKDGNVFAVIGMISEKLNKSGLKDRADEFSEKALKGESYEDVIELALNYVKIDEIPNR